jgi:hypothetical protein
MKLLVLALLLNACAATMVSGPGGSDNLEFAPVNEAQRSGTIKYLNQGADFVIKGRRADAYKQMHTACRGPYKIDSEGPQADGQAAVVAAPVVLVSEGTQYWYIRFSCVK